MENKNHLTSTTRTTTTAGSTKQPYQNQGVDHTHTIIELTSDDDDVGVVVDKEKKVNEYPWSGTSNRV